MSFLPYICRERRSNLRAESNRRSSVGDYRESISHASWFRRKKKWPCWGQSYPGGGNHALQETDPLLTCLVLTRPLESKLTLRLYETKTHGGSRPRNFHVGLTKGLLRTLNGAIYIKKDKAVGYSTACSIDGRDSEYVWCGRGILMSRLICCPCMCFSGRTTAGRDQEQFLERT